MGSQSSPSSLTHPNSILTWSSLPCPPQLPEQMPGGQRKCRRREAPEAVPSTSAPLRRNIQVHTQHHDAVKHDNIVLECWSLIFQVNSRTLWFPRNSGIQSHGSGKNKRTKIIREKEERKAAVKNSRAIRRGGGDVGYFSTLVCLSSSHTHTLSLKIWLLA